MMNLCFDSFRNIALILINLFLQRARRGNRVKQINGVDLLRNKTTELFGAQF